MSTLDRSRSMTREEKVQAYNDALARGDAELAKMLGDKLLDDIHNKIMEEDGYVRRTM